MYEFISVHDIYIINEIYNKSSFHTKNTGHVSENYLCIEARQYKVVHNRRNKCTFKTLHNPCYIFSLTFKKEIIYLNLKKFFND